jgi:hypothetical protein
MSGEMRLIGGPASVACVYINVLGSLIILNLNEVLLGTGTCTLANNLTKSRFSFVLNRDFFMSSFA